MAPPSLQKAASLYVDCLLIALAETIYAVIGGP